MTAKKGTSAETPPDPHTSRPSQGQQNVQFGNTATTESLSTDYGSISDQDEDMARGISRRQKQRNLAEIKSLAMQLAREEDAAGVGPQHKSRSDIAKLALSAYATTIWQTKMDATNAQNLPAIENVDVADLHRRLLDEAKHHQAIAVHVQEAADMIAKVTGHGGQKLAPEKRETQQAVAGNDGKGDDGDTVHRVLKVAPTKEIGETDKDARHNDEHYQTDLDEHISREHVDRNLAQLHAAAKRRWEEEFKSGNPTNGLSKAAYAESVFREYVTAISKERGEDVAQLVDILPSVSPTSDRELLARLKEEVKARQSIERNKYGGQAPDGIAAHVQSAADQLEQLIASEQRLEAT